MTTNILILKLNSGEELLTEAVEKNGVYLCTNPLLILGDVDEQSGQFRMGMTPFMPYADADAGMGIPTNMAIVAIPTEDLANHYREKFGKIITPPAQKIFTGA